MDTHENEPILVVCADQGLAFDILQKLYDEGFTVAGSAPSAGVALTLAAQTMPRIAILAGQTSGRRSAAELAAELGFTWGVECFVLSLDADQSEPMEAPAHGAAAALARALGEGRLRAA